MANRNQNAVKPSAIAARVREFNDIQSDLNAVKCALTCACLALGHSQDVGDHDLGAKAWRVINSCVEGLDRLEDDLNDWDISHERSLKGVSHV